MKPFLADLKQHVFVVLNKPKLSGLVIGPMVTTDVYVTMRPEKSLKRWFV